MFQECLSLIKYVLAENNKRYVTACTSSFSYDSYDKNTYCDSSVYALSLDIYLKERVIKHCIKSGMLTCSRNDTLSYYEINVSSIFAPIFPWYII